MDSASKRVRANFRVKQHLNFLSSVDGSTSKPGITNNSSQTWRPQSKANERVTYLLPSALPLIPRRERIPSAAESGRVTGFLINFRGGEHSMYDKTNTNCTGRVYSMMRSRAGTVWAPGGDQQCRPQRLGESEHGGKLLRQLESCAWGSSGQSLSRRSTE